MRIALGIVAAAVLWASPAMAARWYLVDFSTDKGHITFIDRDSIRQTSDGHMRAQVYSVFDPPKEKFAAMLIDAEIDCADKRRLFVNMKAYDRDEVKVYDGPGGEWTPTQPNSQGATFVEFICSRGIDAKEKNLVPSTGLFATGRDLLSRLRAGGAKDGPPSI